MRISDWSSTCALPICASSSPSRRKTIASAQVTGAAPHRRCSAPDTVPRLIRAAWTLRKRQSDLFSLRRISMRSIFMENPLTVTTPPSPSAATQKPPQRETASPAHRSEVCHHADGPHSSFHRQIHPSCAHYLIQSKKGETNRY